MLSDASPIGGGGGCHWCRKWSIDIARFRSQDPESPTSNAKVIVMKFFIKQDNNCKEMIASMGTIFSNQRSHHGPGRLQPPPESLAV